MLRRAQRGLLSVFVPGLVVTALAGCGTRGEETKATPPAGPTTAATPSAAPTTPLRQRPKAPVPTDRNPAAVSAALTALDPCAMLARATVTVPGLPANAEHDPMDPHTCVRGDFSEVYLSVSLGNGVDAPDRFREQSLTVAGAKAYFQHFGVDLQAEYERCRVGVPVSFQDAVDIEVQLASGKARVDLCRRLATTVGVSVVKAMATPQAFPDRLPNAHRDACAVLAEALGEPLRYPGYRHVGSVDRCDKKVGKRGIDLQFDNFFADLEPGDDVLRIGGKTVDRTDYTADCTLTWSDGPSGVPGRYRKSRMIKLNVELENPAANCTRAAALAPAVMRALAKPAPVAVSPQRPLTYRPGEPDTAAAGACADLWKPRSCAPYTPVPAPRGADQVLRGVQADPNAGCAIAADTVRKQLGPAFRPVTSQRRTEPKGPYDCAFVEPSHGLTVWVRVAPPPAGITEYPTLTVGGRPAVTHNSGVISEDERLIQRDSVVIDVTDRIELTVVFEFSEPRSPVDDPPLDTRRTERLRPVVAGIVTSYLR